MHTEKPERNLLLARMAWLCGWKRSPGQLFHAHPIPVRACRSVRPTVRSFAFREWELIVDVNQGVGVEKVTDSIA
jgi:hypothetical protein